MLKVCHVLGEYGHSNQPYLTTFIGDLALPPNESAHIVFCNQSLKVESSITIIERQRAYKIKPMLCLKIVWLTLFSSIWRDLKVKIGLREAIKWGMILNTKPTIYHIHHAHIVPFYVLEFIKAMGSKVVVSLRGRDLLLNHREIPEGRMNDLERKLKICDVCHTISAFMKEKALEIYGIQSRVIYRGVEPMLGRRVKLHRHDQLSIIVVGRLVWEKGHVLLLEELYKLHKCDIDFKVDIYGDGSQKEALLFRIQQLGLEKRVILKGHVDNDKLISTFDNYDFAIQPSLTEALSNGLLGMVRANIPVIVTNVGGMIEIIEDGINGIVMDVLNYSELKTAIERVLSLDSTNLQAYNLRLLKKFSRQKELAEFQELYRRLAD